jgi:hypothetical protein
MTADETRRSDPPGETAGGAGFWIAVVLGTAIGGYGLVGLLDAAPATRPPQALLGAFGLNVLHDAVLAPLACVIGVVLARLLPVTVRRPVRTGLFATFVVLLVGWAPLRGYGRARVPDNPTVDPLNYATAVVTVLAVVWVLIVAWIACDLLARRRAG